MSDLFAQKLLAPLTAGFDRAAARVLFGRTERSRQRSSAESLGPTERRARLAAVEAFYGQPRYFEDPDSFFVPMAPDDPREERVRGLGDGGEVVDLRWHSALLPLSEDPDVIRRLEARADVNHTAVARVFRHRDRARPAIVLVHGYMGGAFAVEELAFPVRALFDRGLDVVLAVLPHHGARGVRGRRPLLPASDPRITIEAFRHAMVDLRTLVAMLRERGAPAVGAMGMSLGGYSSALLATIEGLDFVVPMIPLASIADFARDADRLVGTATQRREQHEAIERAHRVVSPLARPSRVPSERALVIAGASDRITPASHAEKLAAHLGAPLHLFGGGHLLQLGRRDAFREVLRMLARQGLLGPRA